MCCEGVCFIQIKYDDDDDAVPMSVGTVVVHATSTGDAGLSSSAGAATVIAMTTPAASVSEPAGMSASAVGTASASTAGPSTTTSTSARPTTATRPWANRRRPRSLRSVTSQNAAEKIASLADVRKVYYSEKLAMKRRQHELLEMEHAKKMKVLDLQEQIAVKQLMQLEE